MANYSRIPWAPLDDADSEGRPYITDADGLIVAKTYRAAQRHDSKGAAFTATIDGKANAEFLCLAVNVHDQLVREVAELRVMLKYLRDHPGECLADHPNWLAKIDALLGPEAFDGMSER